MQRNQVCPKCHVVFALKRSRHTDSPMLLECGHNICDGCVKKLKCTVLTCPICKAEVEYGDVKMLIPDLYTYGCLHYNQLHYLDLELNKATSSFQKFIGKKHVDQKNMCQVCVRKKATQICKQCQQSFCDPCFRQVHTTNLWLDHFGAPFGSDAIPNKHYFQSFSCEHHEQRPLEYFCEDDNIGVCSKCVTVGDHKDHNIASMEEKNKEVFRDLQGAVHIGQKVLQNLHRSQKLFYTMVPAMKSEISEVIEEIQKYFTHVIGLIQIRQKEVIANIFKFCEGGIDPIATLHEKMIENQQKLESTVKAANEILHSGGEVVLDGKVILDDLLQAKDIPCILEQCNDSENKDKLRFEPSEKFLAILGDLNTFGSLTGKVSLGTTWHTISEQKGEVMNPEDVASLCSVTSFDSCSDTTHSDDVIIEGYLTESLDGSSDSASSISGSLQEYHRAPNHFPVPAKSRIKGRQERVIVTHIKNPSAFIVQRYEDVHSMEKLAKTFQSYCKSSSKADIPLSLHKGDYVFAQYTVNNHWYRAVVKETVTAAGEEGLCAKVTYIDYGNSEVLPVNRLRKMMDMHMKHPEYAIECSLSDIVPFEKDGKWSTVATDTFAKMTNGKIMLLFVVQEVSNILHVDLCKPADDDIKDDRPVSVRDSLVFLQLANFISPASSNRQGTLMHNRKFLKPPPLKTGGQFTGLVTHSGDPSCFYVQQITEESTCFAAMLALVQEIYNTDKVSEDARTIYCPHIGMICVCKFESDKKWYRAVVLDLPGNKMVKIQYVDYGNIETVSHDKIRKITDDFIIIPTQAICCTLDDTKEGEFAHELKADWKGKTYMFSFRMTVKGERDGKPLVSIDYQDKDHNCSYLANDWESEENNVEKQQDKSDETEFFETSPSLNSFELAEDNKPIKKMALNAKNHFPDQFSPEKHVKKKTTTEDKEKSPMASNTPAGGQDTPMTKAVQICHFVSPSDFYVQLANSSGLEKLMGDMQAEYKHSDVQWISWEEGAFSAFQCPEDNLWYRGKVVKFFHKYMIEVFAVDFGFTTTVSCTHLRPISKHLRTPQCFAFRCKLADIAPAGGQKWSKTACEFMEEETRDRQLYIQKRGDIDQAALPIDLLIEENVAETALDPASKHFSSLIEKMVDKGLCIPLKSSLGKTENLKEYSILHYPPPTPITSASFNVIPTYVNYSGIIYAQAEMMENKVKSLADSLQERFQFSEAHTEHLTLQVGQACVAVFHLDISWSRAKILEIGHQEVKVEFIDFGNQEYVTLDQVRLDIEEFADIPPLCFPFSLRNIVPASGDRSWPIPLLDQMHEMIVAKNCRVEHFTNEKGVYSGDLTLPDGQDLGQVLQQTGLVFGTDDINSLLEQSKKIDHILKKKSPYRKAHLISEKYLPVTITHVETPDVVYFQHTEQTGSEMNDISDEINNHLQKLCKMAFELNEVGPTLPTITDFVAGMACCAQFTFDECWYRAVIIEKNTATDSVLVQYVDYGNSENVPVDHIRVLPSKYLNLPAQSIRMKLNNVKLAKGEKQWTKKVLDALVKSLHNKDLFVYLQFKDPTVCGALFEYDSRSPHNLQCAYQSLVDEGIISIENDKFNHFETMEPLDEDSDGIDNEILPDT